MPIRTNRGRVAVYRRIWGWPMRSPKHLTAVVLVVAVLVVGISVAVPRLTGSSDAEPGAGSGAGTGAAESTEADAGTDTDAGTETDGGGSADGTTADEQASATADLPTRLPSAPQTPEQAPPAQEALDVALAWAQAWVDHPEGVTNEQWLDGLRPYTTEEYIAAMATVDPANIPAAEVTGEPKARESYTTSVEVHLRTDGPTLAITVISTTDGWLVAHYERAQ